MRRGYDGSHLQHKGEETRLDHWQSPASRGSVGTRADKRQLRWMPATLDDFVSVIGDDDARQPLHQVACQTTHNVTHSASN